MVLEKTFESFLDSKKIKPVNPKENLPWTLATEAEAPKEPDTEKDWRKKGEGTVEDEIVR